MSVAVVRPYGIFMEDAEYIEAMGKRLAVYEKQISKIFLACSDTSIAVPDLEDAVNTFKQTSLALHRDQIDKWAQADMPGGVFGVAGGVRRVPNVPMVLTDDGKWFIEHDRQAIQKARDEQKERDEWVKNSGIEFLTAAIQCSKCQHKFEAKMPCGGPHDHSFTGSCPNCTAGYQVSWVYESGGFSERLTE